MYLVLFKVPWYSLVLAEILVGWVMYRISTKYQKECVCVSRDALGFLYGYFRLDS